jgi:hypothetical protein
VVFNVFMKPCILYVYFTPAALQTAGALSFSVCSFDLAAWCNRGSSCVVHFCHEYHV